MTAFSKPELLRYSRQLILPEVGLKGQEKLRSAAVLIVGVGGLGSPAAYYLACAGVGKIGLADYDRVDLSNLNRQILHTSQDIGRLKVDSAAEKLNALNPEIEVKRYPEGLTVENAREIAETYQIIVDCTDNYPARYLVNDLAVLTHKPVVAGAVFQFEGQVGILDARKGPCFRCLFPEPPADEIAPSCSQIGVVGVLPRIIGVMQASETIKLILGIGSPLTGKMQIFDSLGAAIHTVSIARDPNCPICGDHPSIHELAEYTDNCHQEKLDATQIVTPRELEVMLTKRESFRLIDIRDEIENQFAQIAGAEHMQMQTISNNPALIDKGQRTIFFCRTGNRSAWLVRLLKNSGYEQVQHLKGGINAWVEEIDPKQGKY